MRKLSLLPLRTRINQFVSYRRLHEFAEDIVVVQEAHPASLEPAIFLPGELDRISGVHDFAIDIDNELHLATRKELTHTETIAYRLRDVCLIDGNLCNGIAGRKYTFRRSSALPRLVNRVEGTTALASSDAGNDYFAHFLLDDLCTALMAYEFGTTVFAKARVSRTAHELEYSRALDIDLKDVDRCFFENLWIFADYAQNSHKQMRLREISKRLRSRTPPGAGLHQPVFIRRSDMGRSRALTNSQEIETTLIKQGFTIVDPGIESLDEIGAKISNASLVVGVEGSQLAHGLLHLPPGSAIICIQPAARFNAVYRAFAESLKLHWGFVVAEGTAREFSVSPNRLMKTIDLAFKRQAGAC